jgi:hypothetical protein
MKRDITFIYFGGNVINNPLARLFSTQTAARFKILRDAREARFKIL